MEDKKSGHEMCSRDNATLVPVSSSFSTRSLQSDEAANVEDCNEQTPPLPDAEPRRLLENFCAVCGDHPTKCYYGGVSCDSCKMFFRRAVLSKAFKKYECAFEGKCEINKTTRSKCSLCRYTKCVKIGMENSRIATVHERTAQLQVSKRDNFKQLETLQWVERQPAFSSSAVGRNSFASSSESIAPTEFLPQTMSTSSAFYIPEVSKMTSFMTEDEQREILSLVNKYRQAYRDVPYRMPVTGAQRSSHEIIEMFTTIIQRFILFARLNQSFLALNMADQSNLLRSAIIEMCILRGAVSFDLKNNRWPSPDLEILADCPQLKMEDMRRIMSAGLFSKHINFLLNMQELKIDEAIAMILIMIVLFSPNHTVGTKKRIIHEIQEHYLDLLQKYSLWKYGISNGIRMYARLILSLKYLQELNDTYDDSHMNVSEHELNAMRRSLEELNFLSNPRPTTVCGSSSSSIDTTASFSSAATTVATRMIQSFTDHSISAILKMPHCSFGENEQSGRSKKASFGKTDTALLPMQLKTRALSSVLAPDMLLPKGSCSSTALPVRPQLPFSDSGFEVPQKSSLLASPCDVISSGHEEIDIQMGFVHAMITATQTRNPTSITSDSASKEVKLNPERRPDNAKKSALNIDDKITTEYSSSPKSYQEL